MSTSKAPSQTKRQRTIEYLIINPYATNEQVMAECEVSEGTVVNARRDAKLRGLLDKSYFDHASAPMIPVELPTDPSSGSGLPAEIQEYLHSLLGKGGKPLDVEESLSMLGTMTREAYQKKNFSLVRDCILADANIRKKTEDTNLTLPDPLTPEEFTKHTSDILDCVGPLIAAAALCHAFDVPTRLAFEEEYSRLKATRSPAETPGAKIATAPLESASS